MTMLRNITKVDSNQGSRLRCVRHSPLSYRGPRIYNEGKSSFVHVLINGDSISVR